MAGLFATMVAVALVAVLAIVFVSGKLQQRRDAHRREMQDLIRGKVGNASAQQERPTDRSQFGGVAGAFTSATPPAKNASDAAETAAPIQQLQGITDRAKKKTPMQREEDAMVRSAERYYRETMKEIERENRRADQPRSRPSGPCSLKLHYIDANGVITHRNVAPYKSGNTNKKFDAWCESRQDRRTFFFSRVQSGTDLRTGRYLNRADVFSHIHPDRRVPSDLG